MNLRRGGLPGWWSGCRLGGVLGVDPGVFLGDQGVLYTPSRILLGTVPRIRALGPVDCDLHTGRARGVLTRNSGQASWPRHPRRDPGEREKSHAGVYRPLSTPKTVSCRSPL